MTQRGFYTFTVKEYVSGAPFIAAEPAGETLGLKGDLGFDLPLGTDYKRAQTIARFLNENIKSVTLQPRRIQPTA